MFQPEPYDGASEDIDESEPWVGLRRVEGEFLVVSICIERR
jgi:hypothetical protein